jgi:hypothetical protein
VLFSGLSFVFIGPLRTYRAVQAEDVAAVLIRVALDGQLGCRRIPSKQLIAAVS